MRDKLTLLTPEQVQSLLQLTPAELDWLVKTRQLTQLMICGQARFTSVDVSALIETYKQIAERNNKNVEQNS